jgi:hypothetical protein
MTLILKQDVELFEGDSQTGGQPAVIKLHNDHFVLESVDRSTGASTDIVINTALTDLKVGGSIATLTFTVGDITRRVDFSHGTGPALMTPDKLMFKTSGVLTGSGIYAWLKEFRALGVPVKYRSLRQTMLWASLATVVVLAVISVVVVVQMGVGG